MVDSGEPGAGEHRVLYPIRVNRTLYQEVYESLYAAIMSGRFGSGVQLREDLIAEQLGVSRGPVREALRNLEQSGLVESIPHRGTFVVQLTDVDIEEIATLRIEMEAFAVRLAIQHGKVTDDVIHRLQHLCAHIAQANDLSAQIEADRQFHDYLCSISGHRLLLKLLDRIRGLNHLYITLSGEHMKMEPEASAERHRRIVRAVESGDPDRVLTELSAHIGIVVEQLLEAQRGSVTAGAPR